MNKKINAPRKHHYVPQFYLKNFSADSKKVPAVTHHNPFLIKGNKSISRIAYEDNLYSISDDSINTCIENDLNILIETPFSNTKTWNLITSGSHDNLGESDEFYLYIFIRHLQARNIENLYFLKSEQIRQQDPRYAGDYSQEEREMHERLRRDKNGLEEFYLHQSLDLTQFTREYPKASICIYTGDIPFRTSTNPVIFVPSQGFNHPDFQAQDNIRWLPLTPKVGAMLYMTDIHHEFQAPRKLPTDVVRALNRVYLCQLLEMPSVKHCIAFDEYLDDDLEWAGFSPTQQNINKFKKTNN